MRQYNTTAARKDGNIQRLQGWKMHTLQRYTLSAYQDNLIKRQVVNTTYFSLPKPFNKEQ